MEQAIPFQLHEQIHSRAVDVSFRYRKAEAELMEVLQQVETHQVYLHQGCSSLFGYVVKNLKLSESVAYNLISVMRKSREVPALKTEIEKGTITLSNARKIAPVLTLSNQVEWIAKAQTLSLRQLEKEVVKVRPEQATPERARYVTASRVKLELGLSETDMLRLRKVQDLLSQARGKSVSLEEVLIKMTDEYLERHDPVEKAKRVKVKKGLVLKAEPVSLQVAAGNSRPARAPILAALKHQINLRDKRKCAHINPTGERCGQTRWLEVHHRLPVSEGGLNSLENLITLCSSHHDWIHRECVDEKGLALISSDPGQSEIDSQVC
ncbi:MAG: HNH endonuclease [Xanthomonadaceae bacterium]|nr:HNH endonuclease [Xanthomonadaceae bacterium]